MCRTRTSGTQKEEEVTDRNMPPGSSSRQYDEYSGEYDICRCGERRANCDCDVFVPADPFEYDSRYDDEWD